MKSIAEDLLTQSSSSKALEVFVLPNAFNSENPHSELKVVFYSSKVKLNI